MGFLSFFIFLFCFFPYSAQAQTVKENNISLEIKNEPIKSAFAKITKATNCKFFYDENVVADAPKINLNFSSANLTDILAELEKQSSLKFINEQGTITVSKNSSAYATTQQIIQKVYSGVVTDDSGEPVIGASISLKGSNTGTVTDVDGRFSINAVSGSTLAISYVGYKPQETKLGDNSNLNIVINEDNNLLDEVVVVGYGTQKKITLTGSVVDISNEKLTATPVSNISNALAGRLPGVRVKNSGGIPGSESSVDIRGFGTPLILVDGIEQPGFQIDPNEIESISILKDAAASIYGVKAGNGVLLITTKKGASGKAKITYNGSYGFQNFTSFPKMVNAAQYAELVDEDAMNRGNAPVYGPEKLAKFRQGTEEGYKSYDWYDILTRENAPQTQHNLNISGGNDKVNYFTSVGYLNQEGLYASGDLGFDRYNFRSNIDATIANHLTAEVQLSGRIENKQAPYDGDLYILNGVFRMFPIHSPYANDNDPSYLGVTNFANPYARTLADVAGYSKNKRSVLNGQFSLKYDVPFVTGLSAKLLYSYLTIIDEAKTFSKEYFLYAYDQPTDTYNKAYTGNSPSNLNIRNDFKEQNFLQFTLNYNRTFAEKHHVNALFLYEQREDLTHYISAYRQFDIDVLDQINAGRDLNKNNSGSASELANVSFIGRINYDYLSKYLLEIAFREDGSAKFYKDNRWGLFPSVSAGWRISEESFIKDNVSWFDNLKLRLSYGKMGNDDVAAFQYLTGYTYPGGANYIYGSSVVRSLDSRGLSNLNFTWFSSEIYNGGLDFSIFNRLLDGSIDVFYRKRSGLLAYRSASLPNTFGASMPQENLNSDNYRGFELTLGHTGKIQDFGYSVKANMSYTRARSEYIEQADPLSSYLDWRNNRSDRWSNIEFGYNYVGQFQNQEEINNWAVQDGAGNSTLQPGDLKFADLNGDGVINDLDQQVIGRNNTPEIYFGLDLSAKWKGFDFSVLMQGATNYTRRLEGGVGVALMAGGSSLDVFMDRWHHADLYDLNSPWVPGKYPSTYTSLKPANNRVSQFNTIDATYARVKNVELGYTFPKNRIKKAGVDNLRLYISGNNILTFDNLPYGDPELPTEASIRYPQLKIWNFGVNITF